MLLPALLDGADRAPPPLPSQGSKYQRRWFELTSDTLAYAKDPKELKDGDGDIEVFAIHEIKYVKKLEDDKLEVRLAHGMPASGHLAQATAQIRCRWFVPATCPSMGVFDLPPACNCR